MKENIFLKNLQKELMNHPGVKHPFINEFGNLNKKQLKLFASQFYLYVRTFPRLMGAIVYNVQDEILRLPLLLNLINECGGLKNIENLEKHKRKSSNTFFPKK